MTDTHAPAPTDTLLEQLLQARASGQPIPAPAGIDAAAGAQLQERHIAALLARLGGSRIGMKIGGTNAAAMERMGTSSPFTGPILSSWTHASPARLRRADFLACIVEVEVGLRLRADLGGDGSQPSRAQVLDAIDTVFPAIEVADSRYSDWQQASLGALLADVGAAGAWVPGAPCADWRTLDLGALPVRLLADGVEVRTGSSAAVLGDPLHALALAVASIGRRGQRLRAGDYVTTGTCIAPLVGSGPVALEADMGPLGRVQLTLA